MKSLLLALVAFGGLAWNAGDTTAAEKSAFQLLGTQATPPVVANAVDNGAPLDVTQVRYGYRGYYRPYGGSYYGYRGYRPNYGYYRPYGSYYRGYGYGYGARPWGGYYRGWW